MINHRIPHWFNTLLTFFVTLIGAAVLLPFVRNYPEWLHNHLNGLPDWVRIGFAFCFCVLFTKVMFKLLSPRLGHVADPNPSWGYQLAWDRLFDYPPAWIGALAACIFVAGIDLSFGLEPNGYRASFCEWIGYGVVPVLVVGVVDVALRKQKEQASEDKVNQGGALHNIENSSWEEFEEWLRLEKPAQYDFLGNMDVAQRLSKLLKGETRSIGIVGPYGAGKSTIICWVKDLLKKPGNSQPNQPAQDHKKETVFLICENSCWGFKTSASAVQEMLVSAIRKVGETVDTFQINSLPESYQQTFFAAGGWGQAIANLVLSPADIEEQFSQLSELLKNNNQQLVFIIEDLDRNDTRNFEIQEVLAFLERLKKNKNLKFIIAGGLSSTLKIDYAKLCDHIENLRIIQSQHSLALVKRFRDRCLDESEFKHSNLPFEDEISPWDPNGDLFVQNSKECTSSQVVSRLLTTPRSLRHALGRTYSAWKVLHGEIDFDHLFAMNILRFGAPECFDFLLRHWSRIRDNPSDNRKTTDDNEQAEIIRQSILVDWNRTIRNVEWNVSAALEVMQFILPATTYWILEKPKKGRFETGRQHIHEERYWNRAVNETIDSDDVCDQEVIRDLNTWFKNPCLDSELVAKLTTMREYADIWYHFAHRFFKNREMLLLFCEQVIHRILAQEGAHASQRSLGIVHTRKILTHWGKRREEHLKWLIDQLSEVAKVSLQMVSDLWNYYGTPYTHFLTDDQCETCWRALIDTLKEEIVDCDSLIQRLSLNHPATLLHLISDRMHEDQGKHIDLTEWRWMKPFIVEGLRKKDLKIALNCGYLLGSTKDDPWKMTIRIDVFDQFLGKDAAEVVSLLADMIDDIPVDHQQRFNEVVAAAQQLLNERRMTDEPEKPLE